MGVRVRSLCHNRFAVDVSQSCSEWSNSPVFTPCSKLSVLLHKFTGLRNIGLCSCYESEIQIPEERSMRLIRKFIQWLLVGFTVVLLVPFLVVKQYLTALFLIAASAIIIPFTKPFLEKKLPFLKPAGLRLGLWSIFLVMSVMSLTPGGSQVSTSNKPAEPPLKLSNLTLCTQLKQNQCANDTPALVRIL